MTRTLAACTSLLAFVALLAGCSTPEKEINEGRAKLLPQTVNVIGSMRGDFIVEFNNFGRFQGEVYVSGCQKGTGTIRFIGVQNGSYVTNLIRSGSTPADKLFDEVCSLIMPIAARNELEENRARANMTPEQRAQERAVLLQLIQMQQQQNALESIQNSSDRRNKELIDAIKNRPPVTTNCAKDGYGNVRCTTR